MFYTCEACHYTFNTADYHLPPTTDRCPDCGQKMLKNKYPAIRVATEREVCEYYKYRKEFA